MEDIIDKSYECFPSEISSGTDFICGDPKLFPRVGTQYQAEIPPLTLKCDHGELIKEPFNAGIRADTSDSYSLGLPIPVMWIYNSTQVNKGELVEISGNHVVASNQDGSVESENIENGQTTLINVDGELKNESLDTFMDNGEAAGLINLPSMLRGESIGIVSVSLQERKTLFDHCDGFYLVPDLPNKDWKHIEYSSFLLGLYVFGKNLALIRRFVGSKEMGDILSYYYGKFYKSKEYQRWSGYRKLKGRRCISGQRIFMGWRQGELLSRLSSHVSDECLCMLTEVSKLFGDGNITLEEYVFSLKDKVGINNLVEAVALGKGKNDLTGTAMDSSKANQSFPVRPRLPKSGACSSLTTTEILKILTGNFRLSKARCNDLFWEAVWPRLLARGWHSEQPSDLVPASMKQSLVFLVPDVNKFSRRLEKGNHFFNSISDVLNKVASEPCLLELEVNSDNDDKQKEKRMINPEMEGDPEVSQKQLCHSYLQQNNSTYNQHSMKFTIVDTSLFTGEGRVKVGELRSLPLYPMNSAPVGHLIKENDDSDHVDIDDVEIYGDANDDITSNLKDQLPNGPVSLIKEEQITDLSTNVPHGMQSRLSMKLQSSTEVKPLWSTHFASISEHTNLAVCSYRGLSHKTESTHIDDWFREGKLNYQSSFPDAHANLAGPSQNLSLDSSFSSKQEERHVRNISGNSPASGQPHKNSILDPKDDQGFTMNMLNNPDSLSAAKSSPCETNQHSEMQESINAGTTAEEPPITTWRRQSSRNKPSAKALEAFAYGFMGASKKRKSADRSTSTSSQPVHGRSKIQ